jgi:GxxExxY protein
MLTNPAGMNTLTHAIIGCGIRVHREIGPGVLENIYNECMQYELARKDCDSIGSERCRSSTRGRS